MKKLVMLLALAGIGSIASAQDSQYYFGIDGGIGVSNAPFEASEQIGNHIAHRVPNHVVYQTDKATTFFKGTIGRQFNRNVAAELGYFQTGNFKSTYSIEGTQVATGKASASGFELSGIVKPLDNGVYLKAGVHRSEGSVEVGSPHLGSSITHLVKGTGYLYGIGYETHFSRTVSGNLGYTHYGNVGGDSDVKLDTYTAGFKYRF